MGIGQKLFECFGYFIDGVLSFLLGIFALNVIDFFLISTISNYGNYY